MALDPKRLRNNLADSFKKGRAVLDRADPPVMIPRRVASLLAEAYHEYAISAQAGPAVSMVVPPSPSVLESALVAPMLAGWAPGLAAYWAPVIWTGPGLIPVNPTVPAAVLGVAPEVLGLLSSLSPEDLFLDRLSEILHRYTGQVLVTTTTVPPPVVIPVPLA